MKEQHSPNLLVGMKAICGYLNNVSEATVLKWHRELDLPIRKTGKSGYWVGSKTTIDAWSDAIDREA